MLSHTRQIQKRGENLYAQWQIKFEKWQKDNPVESALLDRLVNQKLPKDWAKALPIFTTEKDIATRAASGKVIQEIAKSLPEFWGGSADLAGSNNTSIDGAKSFLPTTSSMKNSDPYGRIIHGRCGWQK